MGSYDVLAVQPRTSEAFAAACTSMEVDVVSLDLAHRLPYRLRPALIKAALTRGVFFEVLRAWGALLGGRHPGAVPFGARPRPGYACTSRAAPWLRADMLRTSAQGPGVAAPAHGKCAGAV